MPKITRTTQKIFGNDAAANEITAFGTAMSNTPTYTRNVADIFNANFQGGWSDAIEADKAPYEEDTTGLCYAITSQLAYLFQQGPFEWDANTDYYTNSLCTVEENGNLIIKRSTSDNNTGNDPTTDNVNWVDFYSQKVLHTIGDPIITLSNTLNENEIWLEGATVSRTTYASLFAIYGTTYGAGDGSTTFGLPNFKNRALWGSDGFGYIEAGNAQVSVSVTGWGTSGSAPGTITSGRLVVGSGSKEIDEILESLRAAGSSQTFNVSNANQPPAIKVRVKTRYQ